MKSTVDGQTQSGQTNQSAKYTEPWPLKTLCTIKSTLKLDPNDTGRQCQNQSKSQIRHLYIVLYTKFAGIILIKGLLEEKWKAKKTFDLGFNYSSFEIVWKNHIFEAHIFNFQDIV